MADTHLYTTSNPEGSSSEIHKYKINIDEMIQEMEEDSLDSKHISHQDANYLSVPTNQCNNSHSTNNTSNEFSDLNISSIPHQMDDCDMSCTLKNLLESSNSEVGSTDGKPQKPVSTRINKKKNLHVKFADQNKENENKSCSKNNNVIDGGKRQYDTYLKKMDAVQKKKIINNGTVQNILDKIPPNHYTKAKSPRFSTDQRAMKRNNTILSTEERDIMEIKKKKQMVEKQMNQNKKFLEKNKKFRPIVPQPIKGPTVPQGFKLNTQKTKEAYAELKKEVKIRKQIKQIQQKKEQEIESLRNALLTPKDNSTRISKITISHSEKKEITDLENDFISLKARIDNFFITKPKSLPSSAIKERMSSTQPNPPKLHVDERMAIRKSMEAKPVSTEEQILFEIINQPTFKARKVNKNMLYGNGKSGIPEVYKRPTTEFQEFNLHTNEKKMEPEPSVRNWEAESCMLFKAKPLNKKIFEKPDFVVKKTEKKTEVKQFNFQTERRIEHHRKNSKNEEKIEDTFQFKAKPMPEYKEFRVFKSNCFATEPIGHSYSQHQTSFLKTEERGENKRNQFSKYLESESKMEDDQRLFKAQPIPEFKHPMNIRKSISCTIPNEFEFKTESRIKEKKAEEIENKENQSENYVFKANPMPDYEKLYSNMMKKRVAPRPITQPVGIKLHLDERSLQRKKFDEDVELMRKIYEERENERREKQEKENQEQIKKIREAMQFKAKKIFKGKNVPIMRSTAELTIPTEPVFLSEERLSARKNKQESEKSDKKSLKDHPVSILRSASNSKINSVQNSEEKSKDMDYKRLLFSEIDDNIPKENDSSRISNNPFEFAQPEAKIQPQDEKNMLSSLSSPFHILRNRQRWQISHFNQSDEKNFGEDEIGLPNMQMDESPFRYIGSNEMNF